MRPILLSLILAALIISSCVPESNQEQTQNPEQEGYKIVFSLVEGEFTYLNVEGTDPKGVWREFEERYPSGLPLTSTEGYWWEGTVVLVFDISGVGREVCIIHNLHGSSGQAIVRYDEKKGCSGESESARTLGRDKVLWEYMESDDAYGVFGAASLADDSLSCITKIGEAFAGKLNFMIIPACGNAILDINQILYSYGLQISDKSEDNIDTTSSSWEDTGSTPEPVQEPPASIEEPTIEVIQTTNCREGPSAAYEVVYSFPGGTEFVIVGRNGQWWLVPIDLASQEKNRAGFTRGKIYSPAI